MATTRRGHGFRALGEIGLARDAIPARRARQLELHAAWQAAAGEGIARRARPVRIARGVLEVIADDSGWARELRRVLPVVGGRIATARPAWGIRRVRLLVEGEDPRSAETIPVEFVDGPGSPPYS